MLHNKKKSTAIKISSSSFLFGRFFYNHKEYIIHNKRNGRDGRFKWEKMNVIHRNEQKFMNVMQSILK